MRCDARVETGERCAGWMDAFVCVRANAWERVGIRRVLARGASSGTHRLPGRVAHPFIPCARARSGSEGRTREDAKGGGEAGGVDKKIVLPFSSLRRRFVGVARRSRANECM